MPVTGVELVDDGNDTAVPPSRSEEDDVLVYQSRNSPAWGRVRPQAFGFREEIDDEVEIDVSATDRIRAASPSGEPPRAEITLPDPTRQEPPR